MRTAALLALVLLAWAFPAAPGAAAAAPNRLVTASVTPTSGTTATVFTFSVHYQSKAGSAAVSVSASVAGLTVPLTLTTGTPVDGTYAGTSTLPAGSWMVTFQAFAQAGNSPTASAGPVVVSPAPTPTPPPPPPPPPTPPPTPPPPATASPTPTAAPASAAPWASASASLVGASASPAVIAPGTGGQDGSSGGGAAGPTPAGDDLGSALLPAFGILAAAGGMGAWWLFAARRRRSPVAVAAADTPLTAPDAEAPARAAPARRQLAEWELASALEDEPIGTVADEAEVANGADLASSLPAAPGLAGGAPRGNPRARRMAEMHSWRDGDDRRTLLHRIGLPDGDD